MNAGFTCQGYRPGALAQIVLLHMDYYASIWGFGRDFETKIAGELSAFLSKMNPDRDLFCCIYCGEVLLGSISIDAKDAGNEGAHLRWFIVSEAARGKGLGARLMDEALAFCRGHDYTKIYLTTFAGLDAARHLYDKYGFRLASESDQDQWRGGVREQRFELDL